MLTLKRIREADALRGPGRFRETPLHFPASLNSRLPGRARCYLKLELFQRTGSFKVRGATAKLHRLSKRERDMGIIAASAGNHAQGVALAASGLGARSRIVMPEHAHISAEPAGATPIAALFAAGLVPDDGPVAAIITGGNIDTFEKTRYIRRALAEERRHLRIRVLLVDRRGSKPREMAEIFRLLADQEINILDIAYRRDTLGSTMGVVEVEFLLETRGGPHADALEASLRDAGFDLA